MDAHVIAALLHPGDLSRWELAGIGGSRAEVEGQRQVDAIDEAALDCRNMDVQEIESAITQLPKAQLAELAAWFEQFHAQLWENQIEQDVRAGRLNSLLNETEADLDGGRCKPL